MKTIISIIVPVYKVEKFLSRCIDSILNQTFKHFECILIDDGSPDKCSEICDKYIEKDKRIRVIHKNNEGVSIARNTGIKIARGKYIGFVDSDDFIEPEMFQYLYNQIEKNDVDIAICGIKQWKNGKARDIPYSFSDGIYNSEQLRSFMFIPSGLEGFVFVKLFKRKIIETKNIVFDKQYSYMEDTFFTYNYLLQSKFGFIASKYLYNYWSNPDSITGGRILPEGIFSIFSRIYSLETNDKIKSLINKRREAYITLQVAKSKIDKNYVLPRDFPSRIEQKKGFYSFMFDKNQKVVRRLYYFILIKFPFVYRLIKIIRK